MTVGPAARALASRRSRPVVGADAPTRREIETLLRIAGRVADHGALRPWRIVALRGSARARLGAALAEAAGLEGAAAARMAAKPLRAPLLLAIVCAPKPSFKVADWEQEAVAAGVGHALSLLLDEAGWGVIWRTGPQTRSDAVRRAHGLGDAERLLGWLYVGSREGPEPEPRRPVSLDGALSYL